MKKYQYLLFDLDGTIIDSSEGVCKSFAYALEHYGITVDDLGVLRPVIGPPLKDSFMNLYKFDEAKATEAVAKYRERYTDVGILECRVYDGVRELLKELAHRGYKLVLATSKPEVFARRIMERYELDGCFHFIAGAQIDGTISNKEDVLGYILKSLNITDVSDCLMIGDTKYDLAGAQYFGIDALGVLYGFGTRDELNAYPKVGLADSADAIATILP